MVRLGTSVAYIVWYNCIYWSKFEKLSDYKSSAMPHLVIIWLACMKATVKVILLPALPSFGGVVLCYINKSLAGHSMWCG